MPNTPRMPFRATINGQGVTVHADRYEYDDGTVTERVVKPTKRPPPPGNLGFYRWRLSKDLP